MSPGVDEAAIVARPPPPADHSPRAPLRFVTATALFDGHDASIHVFRRLLQRRGAEVVHLGHNRAAAEIADAAAGEDADAVAVSSYQGGHNEFFRYLVDLLREAGRGDIRVFAGGGGVIRPDEAAAPRGVRRRPDLLAHRRPDARHRRDRRGHAGRRRARPPPSSAGALPRTARCPVRRCGSRQRGRRPTHQPRRKTPVSPTPSGSGCAGGSASRRRCWDHRHRRRREEFPAGRTRPPVPRAAAGSGRGADLPDRHPGGGPFEAAHRRRPARRPDPAELPPRLRCLLPEPRHPPFGDRTGDGGGGRDPRAPRGGVRTRDRGDRRHRPGGLPDRGCQRFLALCDDSRLRRREPARKDRHARPRRRGGAQQGRSIPAAKMPSSRRAGPSAAPVTLPRDADTPVLPTVASRFRDPGLDRLHALVRDGLAGARAGGREPAPVPPGGADPGRSLFEGARLIPPARAGYLAEIAETLRAERTRIAAEAVRAGRTEHLEAALAETPRRRRRGRGDRRARGAAGGGGARARTGKPPPAGRMAEGARTLPGGHPRGSGPGRSPRSGNAPGNPLGHADPEGRPAALFQPAGSPAVPARREPARQLPVHRRGIPVPADRGEPPPPVRARAAPPAPTAGSICSPTPTRRSGSRWPSTA